jgi:hypothetical protein
MVIAIIALAELAVQMDFIEVVIIDVVIELVAN